VATGEGWVLRDALRQEPDDPFAHGIHALVLVDLDRAEEALQSASTAIMLAPDLSLGHTARARALLSLERFKEGETSANEAIRLDPEDADTQVVLAAALLGRGRYAEALAAADKALSLEPESESALGLRAVALGMSERGSGWEEARMRRSPSRREVLSPRRLRVVRSSYVGENGRLQNTSARHFGSIPRVSTRRRVLPRR
jgi:predicted Zn-dependent protease